MYLEFLDTVAQDTYGITTTMSNCGLKKEKSCSKAYLGATVGLFNLADAPRGHSVPDFHGPVLAGGDVELALWGVADLIYPAAVVIGGMWRCITQEGVDVVEPDRVRLGGCKFMWMICLRDAFLFRILPKKRRHLRE